MSQVVPLDCQNSATKNSPNPHDSPRFRSAWLAHSRNYFHMLKVLGLLFGCHSNTFRKQTCTLLQVVKKKWQFYECLQKWLYPHQSINWLMIKTHVNQNIKLGDFPRHKWQPKHTEIKQVSFSKTGWYPIVCFSEMTKLGTAWQFFQSYKSVLYHLCLWKSSHWIRIRSLYESHHFKMKMKVNLLIFFL